MAIQSGASLVAAELAPGTPDGGTGASAVPTAGPGLIGWSPHLTRVSSSPEPRGPGLGGYCHPAESQGGYTELPLPAQPCVGCFSQQVPAPWGSTQRSAVSYPLSTSLHSLFIKHSLALPNTGHKARFSLSWILHKSLLHRTLPFHSGLGPLMLSPLPLDFFMALILAILGGLPPNTPPPNPGHKAKAAPNWGLVQL